MNINIDLNRQVFDKKKFDETVDTSFTQLVTQPDPTFFDLNLATVEDFFTLYEKFFFQIPKEGEINSHTYLIKESSDYVGFQANSEDIQALLDEIAQLRQENLLIRQEQIDIVKQIDPKYLLVKNSKSKNPNSLLTSDQVTFNSSQLDNYLK
jgi:hypothetical protein